MSDLENMKARRSAIYAELAGMTSAAAGGKPNSRDGGIDHTGYKAGLYSELKSLNELILSGEPYEIVEEGYTP